MRAKAAALLLLMAAACGGGAPSAPASSPAAPTVPIAGACAAIGETVSSATAVVNGAECSPANSSIVLLNLKDSAGFQAGSCTGTVIAPRAVLTAAHCLPPTTASVLVFPGTGAQQTASSFAPHPSWRDSNSTAFDVGIVLMPSDIGRAPVPLLLSRDGRAGETAVIAGWGKDASGVLATLRAGVATLTAVAPLTLQTSFTNTASSVCQGDSGGPILLQEGGTWAVAGVISANSTLACSFGDNFYANLRHPEISAFILGRAPEAGRR